MRNRPWLLGALVLALLLCASAILAAVSLLGVRALLGSPVGELLWVTPDVDTAATAVPATGRQPTPGGRLVVVGNDGDIYTMRPDGRDRVMLADGGATGELFRQPAWSPDGRRVAWVEIAVLESGVSAALRTSDVDAAQGTRADMGAYAPFYLYWSPDGRQVACLSNWEDGLALRVVDVGGGGTDVTLVGRGQPFYFAWAPDSRRLLAHINDERLSLLSPMGVESTLLVEAGTFGPPAWAPDGSQLVYARPTATGQQLVLADVAGQPIRELATFEGSVSFTLSPDGQRVAYAITSVQVPSAAFGPLFVAELTSGTVVQVNASPTLGFYWSPDSSRLAYLLPSSSWPEDSQVSLEADGARTHDGLWLQWLVWDGTSSVALSRFSPSDTYLLDYLRFFDQYARSMTPWAPDSSAFAYAGESEGSDSGVWVQPVGGRTPARRVGDGVYAAWSPR